MNWFDKLTPVLTTREMADLKAKVKAERAVKPIWPAGPEVFSVFQVCPYENTRVVILGQDPYPNQHAHGIAFSSKQSRMECPKSLANIFKEVYDELYINSGISYVDCFPSTDLTCWVKQGVLLMNTVLTAEQDKPDSHANLGWDFFTDKIMEMLNNHPNDLVFMLWGSRAKKFRDKITQERHLVLEAAHPSPLSAANGFFGCGHFTALNEFLKKKFYADLIRQINEIMPYSQLAEITGKYLQNRGIQITFEDMKQAAIYYGERFPGFVELLSPEISSKYVINFKTVSNGN